MLLHKAEGAWSRGAERVGTLAFTDGSFPDYLNLSNRESRTLAHGQLRNAERAGAISVEWDRHAGDDGQITRLRVVNADRLAVFLGVDPLWDACSAAATALGLGETSPPMVRALHAAWCAGRSPRKLGPNRVCDFVDALRVIDARRDSSDDAPLRRVSARLFKDSKRIEAITPALDLLLAQSLGDAPRPAEEVWTGLGLVKHPQSFLCAGDATLRLASGSELRLPSPYVGIAPSSLLSVTFGPNCRYVLSVENLTTFNELAQGKAGELKGLLLYTAGMPSPNFARAYQTVLGGAPRDASTLHWGDIDLGGYRIAAALNIVAKATGRAVQLFRMNPSLLDASDERRPLTNEEAREMIRIANANGWCEEAAGVERAPLACEQEALTPRLPEDEAVRTTPQATAG